MITSLEIQNFRGLKQVTLTDLRRVNLIVGGNDTGKTSVLESLVLLFGNRDLIASLPHSFRNNQGNGGSSSREDDTQSYWNWLFFDCDPKNAIRVKATDERGHEFMLHTGLTPAKGNASERSVVGLFRDLPMLEGDVTTNKDDLVVRFDDGETGTCARDVVPYLKVSRLSVQPPNPVEAANRFNEVAQVRDGEKRFEEIMRHIDARVQRLRYLKPARTSAPMVYVDLGLSKAIPATQMGQAFNRLLHIYTEIVVSQAKILLVDEIENGIYSESLQVIWKGLLTICEQEGVQLFATTHSRECVMAAHAAAMERGMDDLCVQRLQLVKGQVEAVHLGKKHLELAAEMGLEVRS